MNQLNYAGAMRARISQDIKRVVLCFEQGPEGIKVMWHFFKPRGMRPSSERVILVKRTMKPREANEVL